MSLTPWLSTPRSLLLPTSCFFAPKGLCRLAQGCMFFATLGTMQDVINPKGVALEQGDQWNRTICMGDTTPLGLDRVRGMSQGSGGTAPLG